MKNPLSKLKNKLFPKKQVREGVECGYCGDRIWKDMEVGGKLHLFDGKPICARDRVLGFSTKRMEIQKDKKKFLVDKDVRDKFQQDRADAALEEVALQSQLNNPEVRIKK